VLKCVQNADLPPEVAEYVIVDNKSADTTRDVVRKYKDLIKNIEIKYIFEKRQGCNFARNTGLDSSCGDYIIFLDDDVVFKKDFFLHYIAAFKEYPSHDIFGGKIVFPKPDFELPNWIVTQGKYHRPMILVTLDKGDKNSVQPLNSEFPVSINMAVKRSAFDKCGFFRTDLGLSGKKLLPGADYELFIRFSSLIDSWIYVAGASVEHPIKRFQARKAYFRRRLFGVGRISYRLGNFQSKKKLFGLPLYVIEFTLKNMALWIKYTFKKKPVESFFYQTEMIQYIGCMYEHFYKLRRRIFAGLIILHCFDYAKVYDIIIIYK